jgi:predicted SAM-dependent methyltransferase
MQRDLYMQYGCGFSAPVEWKNFDSSQTLRWERTPILGRWTKNAERFPPHVKLGDIVAGLPLPDGSCKGIYASHVLEHLARDDFYRALENTFKLLAPGGIFRVIVPDLAYIAREYIRMLDQGDPEAGHYLVSATILGEETRARGLFAMAYHTLNTSRHLWMWDEFSLRKALQDRGFDRVRKCAFDDCEDPMFRLVEDPRRFERAVAMEARKPTVQV